MVLAVGKRTKTGELGVRGVGGDPTLRNSQRQENLDYWLTGALIWSPLRVLENSQGKID